MDYLKSWSNRDFIPVETRISMNLPCAWCLQRNATFELVIYHLSRAKSVVANGEKVEQVTRGSKYLSVKLCKSCLPATTFSEYAREQNEASLKRREREKLL